MYHSSSVPKTGLEGLKELVLLGHQGLEDLGPVLPELGVGPEKVVDDHRGGAGEEVCAAHRRVQVGGVAGALVKVGERAGGVAGDFAGDRKIGPWFGAKVACDAAAWFLDAGFEEPLAGAVEIVE